MSEVPTEAEFRAIGFTGEAAHYPLSDAAFRWRCRFNGMDPKQAPRAWHYAPNVIMQALLEAKAREEP